MKNKRIFVAALLLAAAAFLFTACTQSGNSSGSSNTTNNGGNNGGNTGGGNTTPPTPITLNDAQQTAYNTAINQVVALAAVQEIPANEVATQLKTLNQEFEPHKFKVVDTKEGQPIAKGATAEQLKARFIPVALENENNGGNNGGNTPQNSLQQVWLLSEMSFGQGNILPQGIKAYMYFCNDGYAYGAYVDPTDNKLYQQMKAEYTVEGSNIKLKLPANGPVPEQNITATFKIEGDNLTIEAADNPKFVLKGTKSSDYTGDQIKSAPKPPEEP